MKRTLGIIVCVIAAILILIFIFFEIKAVPDVKRGASYNVEEKDTGGLWFFYNMLQARYGEQNVDYFETDDFYFLADRHDHLLIMLNENIGLDSFMTEELQEFIRTGNELLMISNNFNFGDPSWGSMSKTASHEDSIFQLRWADERHYEFRPYVLDSTFWFNKWVSHFKESVTNDSISESESEYPIVFEDILILEDSLAVFRKYLLDSSIVHMHTIPRLFINESAIDSTYKLNFNKTLDVFKSKKVVLHKSKRDNLYSGLNEESFLKYILSQRPLKYAYYLTLLGALIFVFFSSKRKQKQIPVIKESKNTSMDYVETVSSLFKTQNQNGKLVRHMRRNFFHRVKSSYYIMSDDPNFSEKLSRKSKVPEAHINTIMTQLNNADTYAFNDDQLIRLYNDINSFELNRK